ncbi:amino acid ABC transporter substrate-binding protein (PAAT family) [Iodobacter fluviatilis]|uniref:ABC transporter arginine-binding protein 1 n=2 Tax=Iodobacter fluviatilis TaxID=537 RepID=A0A377Q7N5_9NEIS|nr:amino acid ABC transporter substrate-binding protein (PAAT family) [Iodobacter fluviatilis]STQ90728.1 ABC transporter arginine-binding protein 1 precursor [Iodobacter fluviatilis]
MQLLLARIDAICQQSILLSLVHKEDLMKNLRQLVAALIASSVMVMPAFAAERVLTVGSDATFAPFETLNKKQEVEGFDADLIQAVASKAGIQIKLINTPWEGLFAGLNNGERDIVIAAVTITPERQRSMDFTAPYFEAKQLIVVSAKSPIAKLADLKTKKMAVQNGTTGDIVAQKHFGKGNTNIRRYESIVLALQELKSGGVDAVIGDNSVVKNYLINNPNSGFKLIDDTSFDKEFYGIAVKKGNAALLAKLNKGLADVKADGSYQKIYAKYFGK